MTIIIVEILGGCGEYGRNCFYIEQNETAILLDCGVMNDATQRPPNLTKTHVDKLVAVFISHLHKDHTGALPLLHEFGYQGPFILSEGTHAWLKPLLTLNYLKFDSFSKGQWLTVNEQIVFMWGYTGHVIGSVWYVIKFGQHTLFFSGDVSPESTLCPVDLPPQLTYDLAFIDSGNVGEHLNNHHQMNQMRLLIENEADTTFWLATKFTAKSIEILAYLFTHTTKRFILDSRTLKWFRFYCSQRESLTQQGARTLLEILHSPRLCTDTSLTDAIYLSEHAPQNVTSNSNLNTISYKSHLDSVDVRRLSLYLKASRTIYFHTPLLNSTSTLNDIQQLTSL